MKLRSLFGLLLSLLTLAMFGCGGNGGGTPTTVSGEASKGPIIGGDVKIFAIDKAGVVGLEALPTTPLTVTTHGTFGNYSAVINYSGAVKVVVTGGHYLDEATGVDTQMGTQSLSAVVVDVRGSSKVSVTPFTELAVQKAGGVFTEDKIKLANDNVAKAFGLVDDNGATIDIIKAEPSKTNKYKTALGILSKDLELHSTVDLTGRLAEIASGIDAATGNRSDTLIDDVSNATAEALKDPELIGAGLTAGIDPAAVAGVKTGVPAAVQAINTQATITADVKRNDGAPSVGTVVSFAAPTGTLSAATATTDASGVATVTLTSAAEGTVEVTASFGIFHNAKSVTFADPNKPGAITLVAAPATGVINALSPVTLTATVAPVSATGTLAAGTPVTFSVLTGTGTITAATTTNAAGVATAILNSTVVGTVTVSATAGTAPVVTSAKVDVPFISQPTLVTIKIATTGTLPTGAKIGGANVVVTANPSAGLTIADADVTATGVAAVGSLAQPNTLSVATVNLAVLSTGGFVTGEFVTLVYHVAKGTFPTAADFTVALTGGGIIDTTGALLSLTPTIASVTLQ